MKPILPKGTLAIKCPEDKKALPRIIAPPGITLLIIPSDQSKSNVVINNIRIDSTLPQSSENKKLLPKKTSDKVLRLDKQAGSSSCVIDGKSFAQQIPFDHRNRSYIKEISYQDINGEHEQILYKSDSNSSLQAKKLDSNSERSSTPEQIQIDLRVNSPPPYDSHTSSDPSRVVFEIDSKKIKNLSKDSEQITTIYCQTSFKDNNISSPSSTSDKLDTASNLAYLSNNNNSSNNNNNGSFYLNEETIEDLSIKYETDSFEFNDPTPRLGSASGNYEGDFSTLNKICNSSSYENNAWCYSSNEDQPKDYSCTSILNESSEKQDCDNKIDFLDPLIDTSLNQILYYPEKESSYEERRNFAKTLLSSGSETDRKKVMQDTFWIVEDEPLEASISTKATDIKVEFPEESGTPLHKKSKPPRKYVCHICGKVLKGRSSLRPHIHLHMNIKPYECKFCPKKFTQSNVLKNHLRIHTGEAPYKCCTCGKGFKTLAIMRRHASKHSTLRPFKCNTCSKTFKSKVVLQSHKKIHKSGPFSCQYCDKTFETRRPLSTHIQRRHKNQKQYTCSICSRTYHSKGQLKQHINVHTSEKKFSCNICGTAYIWRSGLATHMRTHSFKIQCEMCEVKFTSLKKLEKHRLRHSEPFPHKCTKCDKRFKFSSHLKKHIVKHKDELFCKECNIGFVYKTMMVKHLRMHSQPQT